MGGHSLRGQLPDFGVLLGRFLEAETLHLMRHFWDQKSVARETHPHLLQDWPMQHAQLRTVFPGITVGAKAAATGKSSDSHITPVLWAQL